MLDEAHHLEDTAAQHLGHQVSWFGVIRLFGRLERSGKGLIPSLISELRRREDPLSAASIELLQSDVMTSLQRARTHAQRVFGLLADFLADRSEQVTRLTDAFSQDSIWQQGLSTELDNFVLVLQKLRDAIETVADRLELDEEPDSRTQLLKELWGVIRRLRSSCR